MPTVPIQDKENVKHVNTLESLESQETQDSEPQKIIKSKESDAIHDIVGMLGQIKLSPNKNDTPAVSSPKKDENLSKSFSRKEIGVLMQSYDECGSRVTVLTPKKATKKEQQGPSFYYFLIRNRIRSNSCCYSCTSISTSECFV